MPKPPAPVSCGTPGWTPVRSLLSCLIVESSKMSPRRVGAERRTQGPGAARERCLPGVSERSGEPQMLKPPAPVSCGTPGWTPVRSLLSCLIVESSKMSPRRVGAERRTQGPGATRARCCMLFEAASLPDAYAPVRC